MERESFPVLDSAPVLFGDLRWVWKAFHALSSGRQRAFSSLQPIQVSEIVSYAEYENIRDEEEREDLIHYVQFLDRIFMKDSDAKAKTPRNPKQK